MDFQIWLYSFDKRWLFNKDLKSYLAIWYFLFSIFIKLYCLKALTINN